MTRRRMTKTMAFAAAAALTGVVEGISNRVTDTVIGRSPATTTPGPAVAFKVTLRFPTRPNAQGMLIVPSQVRRPPTTNVA